MTQINIILAIGIFGLSPADFISMVVLTICMFFPVILMIWWGIHNYHETGHVFRQTDETDNTESKLSPEEIAEIRAMPLGVIEMEINHLEMVNCDSFGKEQLRKNEYYHALKRQEAVLTGRYKVNSNPDFPSPDPTIDHR